MWRNFRVWEPHFNDQQETRSAKKDPKEFTQRKCHIEYLPRGFKEEFFENFNEEEQLYEIARQILEKKELQNGMKLINMVDSWWR
jgi:hypothetical protein